MLQAGVLFANGVAILNNDRFLEKSEGYALLTHSYPSASYHLTGVTLHAVGWGYSQIGGNNLGAHPNALKSQFIGGLHAAAYFRGLDC